MLIDFIFVIGLFGIGIFIVHLLHLVFSKGKKVLQNLILLLIELIVLGIFVYAFLPNKNLSGILWMNLIGALFASVILLLVNWQNMNNLQKDTAQEGRKDVSPKTRNWPLAIGTFCILAIAVLFATSFITRITSIDEVYATINLKQEEKAEVLSSTEETPIAIAPETAKRKMLQKFSVIPNSNMFVLGGITAQVVNGEYVYVATVEFDGFFRWLKLKEVPGYFIISATDINAQPEFIEKPITYSPSGYLEKDAARKIYATLPGYASTGAINLEIDENGDPFYVQTLYKEYGVSGLMHYNDFKTAVLDATTGEVKVYDSQKAPEFVDAPITSAAANSINEFFGRYSQGWWNQTTFGAKKDVRRPTDNGVYISGQITPMIDKDRNLLYFTDFTSFDENQDSALGYSLIQARTGEIIYYRDSKVGIMDSDGAISIASKIYPEKKWEASMPVLYNIDGTPTWIVSLMDSKGIFKKYVYINAVDNDIVVDADEAQGALDAYRIQVAQKGSNNKNSDQSLQKEISGKVKRVSMISQDSQTIVSFLLENDSTIYSVTSNNSPMSIFLKEGDNVTFQANVTDDTKAANIEELKIEGL